MTTAFPVPGRHRVSDSVGLPRFRRRAITAFSIPWAYCVSGFMPQSYFESHALTGHCIPAQGANPGKTPIKTNPRPEGTPHRSPHRTSFEEGTGFVEAVSDLCFEGCGLSATCENRGRRTRLQWRLGRRVVVSELDSGWRILAQTVNLFVK